ncbi:UDP-forming cellulose synthase catalytic subunit [Jeongeupia naejangsanensis]|uniref:Cellulose synthase catalytic subunit [UDP-forming] n=1 Tax=Jeongeupia naejangsanensis TaxID=613195 RepID=A0ABS2BL93_9NEIS|nr:UDP-forming cellulose synthase catalytic subunit [Jeongeupia naejangsanensis]MBM3116379.1 UDP-forming cellulose synthase catalytic subunit [Jeongeupia naejangsanensis]
MKILTNRIHSLLDPLGNRGLLWVWVGLCSLGGVLVAANVDARAQLWLAVAIVVLLLGLRRLGHPERYRAFFLFLAAFLTLRYVYWRTTNTLVLDGVLDTTMALLLYVAELYGIVVALLGIFVNIRPLKRKPVPLPDDPALLPTVDVYIPTYNESPELLEVTIRAAMNIRYPAAKLRVYLLDDGGTVQKRDQADEAKALDAIARHKWLRKLCQRHGAHYISRARNEHAKAGNINAALKESHGELIVILDADHVPTVDFLEQTVGFFLRDEKLFLVQTPHFFINPDPIEKNLRIFGRIPSENEMFYSVIQHGLDFWNSAFFCGSAAVLRRRYLEEVGGIAGTSITEDAETALDLHARGYKSVYLGTPLISGLQPETFTGFITQRVRWAQGMVQIFLLKNPLRVPGLKLWQRLCYFSSSFFWFFGYARLMFLLAPLAFLLFGLHIYNATLDDFLAYALPHVIGVMLVSDYLFGKVRWAFVSELYELLQSMFSLPAIFKVFRNPRAPTFQVTPKGEHLDEDFISQLSMPFYLVYLAVVVGMGVGIWRFIHDPLERDIVLVTLAWNTLNLLLLNAAIGALFERRQRRANPRMPADLDAELILFGSGAHLPCRVDDLSASGARLLVPSALLPAGFGDQQADSDRAVIAIYNPALKRYTHLSARIHNARPLDDRLHTLGIEFADVAVAQVAEVVALVHGDSQRWQDYRRQRARKIGIFASLGLLAQLGVRYAFSHYISILQTVGTTLWRRLCPVGGAIRRRGQRIWQWAWAG